MKKLITILLLSCSLFVQAQTANSIANGNWTSPSTWSCTCVPLPGYTITITHNVTLNTDFGYTSGSITVNGSLDDNGAGYDLWVNGGALTINGALAVKDLWTQSGTFNNSGDITATAILNQINLTNNGNFLNIDSMVNSATIINNGNFTNIDSITNTGTFTNNGPCTFNQVTNTGTYTNNNVFTFSDITNTGTIINNDTITALNSVWNLGKINLQTNSHFLVTNDILNNNFLTSNKAVIINNGRMVVMDSWYNTDTVKGNTGSFVVQDSTVNWGRMLGSFDFCDLSAPASSGTIVDFNIGGTISPNITWCSNTSVNQTSNSSESASVYPNPSTGLFTIDFANENILTLRIADLNGKIVFSQNNINSPYFIIDSNLPQGVYFVKIETLTDYKTLKLLIQ